MLGEPRGRDQLEIVALAARQDRGRDLVRLGGREDEHHVRRRLLQRLEQRVECAGRQHVDLVDDVDLALALGRHVARALAQRAHVVDAGVGRAVDLHHVDRSPLGDLTAEVARAAGVRGRPLGTAQRLGQDAGRAGLAHAARAGEQEGVMHALLRDGVGQRARDVLLPDQLVEALGPVLAREDQVRHEGNLLRSTSRGPLKTRGGIRACPRGRGAYHGPREGYRCDWTSSPSKLKRRCRRPTIWPSNATTRR